jgi:hypothetical protein
MGDVLIDYSRLRCLDLLYVFGETAQLSGGSAKRSSAEDER